MEKRKFLWITGIILVAVAVLGYYSFGSSGDKEPVKVNSVASVTGYDWCVPGEIIIEEGLINDEESFRVLRGAFYEGKEVCHVRGMLSQKSYYLTETRDKVFELKNVDGRFAVTKIKG